MVIFDGVDDLDVFGPFEVLANAARAGADVEVRLVSLGRADEVLTSHGARIRPDGTLDELAPGLIVVPGGGWNDRAEQGAWAEANRGHLPEAIRGHHRAGVAIASVCTGAGIVAAAGVLDGRPASTHRSARDDLRERGVEIVDARVVDDGEVLSAGGVTSGIDLALWIVEREWDKPMADGIAAELEHERRGTVHRGPGAA